jgi:hypothetical protein
MHISTFFSASVCHALPTFHDADPQFLRHQAPSPCRNSFPNILHLCAVTITGSVIRPPPRPLGAVFPDTREQGYAYQTHPRTKGSTAYPDAIRDTDYFKDPGSGWQAMPSDLSSPCLCERVFKTVDDMNNLGLRKRLIGEVDVFQLDTTHELYGHMNVNYVRIPAVPSYDNLRPTATREKFSFPIRS